ncbi:MAG: hypothetical protein KGZ93_07415 [Actinobacteria bacterium]|nr:hypothetical protein [Actinomycetota bacterium]
MSDYDAWADAQNQKLDKIKNLLHEIVYTHEKMQSIISEAIVKCQADRGLKDIERYLEQKRP